MRLAIDCDGVLADYIGAIQEWLAGIGWHLERSELDRHYDVWRAIPRIAHLRHEWSRHIEGERGAYCCRPLCTREDFDALRKTFDDIVVVTALDPKSQTWAHDRTMWLVKNYGVMPRDVVFCQRKELVEADVFVDDLVGQCERWQNAHPSGRAYLFRHGYNDYSELPTISSVADLIVRPRATGWSCHTT